MTVATSWLQTFIIYDLAINHVKPFFGVCVVVYIRFLKALKNSCIKYDTLGVSGLKKYINPFVFKFEK